MTSIAQLWIPILASAVLVFFASSLVHMVLQWHKSDYLRLPNEEAVRTALRAGSLPPGQYMTPYCESMKEAQSPEGMRKFIEGPIAFVTVKPSGAPKMGPALGMWFAFTLVLGAIIAYVAGATLAPGASFGQVSRLTGALAFLAYAGGSVTGGIWMGKPWLSVGKDVVDSVIYAAITGAVFAWLWPK